MKVLAIDTANLVMGVAIIDGEKVVGEITTNLQKNHSLRLMPAIDLLMKEVGIKPNELERIVVASGPGSYTGVRIGVTTAKTLAWTLNIPLVGVSSLEVLAQNGRYFDGYVAPLFDARRGQVYTGLYETKEQNVSPVQADQLVLLEDWLHVLKQLEKPVLFLGNDLVLHRNVICERLGKQSVLPPFVTDNPRAAELAFLGLQKEATTDVHSFVPQYLQLAEAEAKWLKAQESKGE